MACKAMVANQPWPWRNNLEMDACQEPEPVPKSVNHLANIRREDLNIHSWAWNNNRVSNNTRHTILVTDDNLEVKFHPSYSSGTGVIRGDTQFVRDHDYYWEIKVLTLLYGTDVMIGVGTTDVDLTKQQYNFCSMLGLDGESWGYSYHGTLHHDGKWEDYGPGFNKHSTIGVHLNMWEGTLSYFMNGKPLGVAFTSLKNHVLYPMVSSTAAHSGIRLVYSYSSTSSLQQLCLRTLSTEADLMKIVMSVPGLRLQATKIFLNYKTPKAEEDIEQNVDTDESKMVIVDSDEENLGLRRSKRLKRMRTAAVNTGTSPGPSRCVEEAVRCCQCGAHLLAYNNSTSDDAPSPVSDTEQSLCLFCIDM